LYFCKIYYILITKILQLYIVIGGLSEIMEIKSHELMILNYFLEENI